METARKREYLGALGERVERGGCRERGVPEGAAREKRGLEAARERGDPGGCRERRDLEAAGERGGCTDTWDLAGCRREGGSHKGEVRLKGCKGEGDPVGVERSESQGLQGRWETQELQGSLDTWGLKWEGGGSGGCRGEGRWRRV